MAWALLLASASPGLAVPANDLCADAKRITRLPFTEVINTLGATREPADRMVCTSDIYPNVWYRFRPSRHSTLCVRTALSGTFVTYPLVDSCQGEPVNHHGFCGPQSDYTFPVARGTDLFIQVTQNGYAGRDLMFTMADAAEDTDGDGIGDCTDVCIRTSDPEQGDRDYDDVGDACDECEGGGLDLDGDGRCGDRDNCSRVFNPGQEDADFDSAGDACDQCAGVGGVDADGDGRCEDDEDNCPTVANPDQSDDDGDSVGDACDPCFGEGPDPDADGLCGDYDNCADTANPEQADADEDGFGDACDFCPGRGTVDTDGDGTCDEADRCDAVFEPEQSDRDGDGVGDACDACPAMPLPITAEDRDGDGRPDACDACRDDPTDACVSALACTLNGALLRVGKDGGSFVAWTGLRGCKGLAAQPGTGKLFTVTYDDEAGRHLLATIDPTTGASSIVAPVDGFAIDVGLAFSADGTLFGYDRTNGSLSTIDPSTGATTVVGATEVTGRGGTGLASDADGGLLVAGDDQLFSVDPATAAAHPIAGLVLPPFCSQQWISGLAVDAGATLLGLLACDVGTSFWSYLVTVDRSTGAIEHASDNLPPSGGLAIPAGFPPAEHCGNCRDDDGDGKVDFEDADCCERELATFMPSRLRLTPQGDSSTVAIAGRLDQGSLPPSSFPLENLHMQLRDETSGAGLCGIIPASAFESNYSRRALLFADPQGAMEGGLGLNRLTLHDARGGLRFALRGRNVPLATAVPGPLRVTLAFHPPHTRPSVTSCHTATVTTRAGPNGAILR